MALTPEIESLRRQSESLTRTAGEMATRATTLPDMLGQALRSKFGEDNPLIQQRGQALGNFLSASDRATAKYGLPQNAPNNVVFSPTERRALVSGERASASVPLFGLNTLIGQGYGGLQNIVESATRAYQAQVLAAQQAAEQSRQSYIDRVNEYLQEQQLAQQRQQAASSGGGDLMDLVKTLLGGKQTQTQQGGGTVKDIVNSIVANLGGPKALTFQRFMAKVYADAPKFAQHGYDPNEIIAEAQRRAAKLGPAK